MDRVVTVTDARSDAYDGNANLKSKTDPDGYTMEYSYNALDLVPAIDYNDAKEVSYRYNKTGDLVSMTNWLGMSTYELNLLHRLTAATEHKGKTVECTYDGVGSQTTVAETDGRAAAYTYDGMAWVTVCAKVYFCRWNVQGCL